MYELILDQPNSSIFVVLKYDLTVRNAAQIKEAFVKSLEQADNIVVDHSSSVEFDISYLQLLIALFKSVESSNKKIILRGMDNLMFTGLLKDSGCTTLESYINKRKNKNGREESNA
jgi:anti-anti-sigma regulatory factor